MPKITFIGGGSAKFVAALVRDLFTFEELRDSQICLMDIDEQRLEKDRSLLYQAVQADPMTGMVLTLPRIRQMVDEMFEENRQYMKDWSR
jgi:alpha-galactosidase/6-phospho-beta-glucosidase family protein